jgi:hypothetical protein
MVFAIGYSGDPSGTSFQYNIASLNVPFSNSNPIKFPAPYRTTEPIKQAKQSNQANRSSKIKENQIDQSQAKNDFRSKQIEGAPTGDVFKP